jgi:dTDP-4-dehydrorhamnose 3,5-epimerase
MTKCFEKINTPIHGVFLIKRKPILDQRGFFSRFYCKQEFAELDLSLALVQMNHTLTKKKGAIRGMHFQHPPHGETKIVSCLHGKVMDVAVDLRINSPTFLNWHTEVLSDENQASLYIPVGCAHGFQTLTDNCQLLYIHDEFYNASSEGAIHPLDPILGIEWPLEISEMSQRDQNHPFLNKSFKGI